MTTQAALAQHRAAKIDSEIARLNEVEERVNRNTEQLVVKDVSEAVASEGVALNADEERDIERRKIMSFYIVCRGSNQKLQMKSRRYGFLLRNLRARIGHFIEKRGY